MPRERFRYQVKCDYEEKTFLFDHEPDAREKFEQLKTEHGDGVRLYEILERYYENDDEWITLESEVIDYFDAEPEEEN